MDDLNLFHILRESVEDLGHGVELKKLNDVDSKTLVCFLDKGSNFYFGYCYKNGSNLRVVTWDREAREIKNKIVPCGYFVVAFMEEKTQKSLKKVTADDLQIQWFGEEHQTNVKKELKALLKKEEKIEELINVFCRLTTQQLQDAIRYVSEKYPALPNKIRES